MDDCVTAYDPLPALPAHAESCPGAHTADVTCAEVAEWRAWSDKYQKPWQCEQNPYPTGWGLHNPDGDGDTCRYCGVRLSELPHEDPEDAPWRRRAQGEQQ